MYCIKTVKIISPKVSVRIKPNKRAAEQYELLNGAVITIKIEKEDQKLDLKLSSSMLELLGEDYKVRMSAAKDAKLYTWIEIVDTVYCKHENFERTEAFPLKNESTITNPSIGWFYSKDEDEGGGILERLVYEEISEIEAQRCWELEKSKRLRLASAVANMLVRSFSLPKASRFARSIRVHASSNYPDKPIFYNKMTSNTTIEDIMIELAGLSGLNRERVFQYIKLSVSGQSNPPQAIVLICTEVERLLTLRPVSNLIIFDLGFNTIQQTLWVIGDLNIILTEEIRSRNDKFIMSAASGEMDLFNQMLSDGKVEITTLHNDLKYTCLHAAADFGKFDAVKEIIKTGVSLNMRDARRGRIVILLIYNIFMYI